MSTKRSHHRKTTPKAPIKVNEVESDELRDALPETLLGKDDLSEALGEAAVLRATGGDDPEEDLRDQEVEEDDGGPFLITTGKVEFAHGTDLSNPPETLREPVPRV
jgi:hypothetical protein